VREIIQPFPHHHLLLPETKDRRILFLLKSKPFGKST
jgi:hypothetical protein